MINSPKKREEKGEKGRIREGKEKDKKRGDKNIDIHTNIHPAPALFSVQSSSV